MKKRTVGDDCSAVALHRRWLAYWANPNRDGVPPEPQFKDCENCPLVATAISESGRRSICASCPVDHLPTSPGVAYLFAQDMAALPDYVLAKHVDEMTLREHRAIATVREFRESERMAALMGASLG